ncbi:MAG: ATP-binding protein [Acidimicrobiia bacterium]
MTKSRRTLRRRLVVAMAGIAVGVLVITGVATIGLARRSAANNAEQQLQEKAPRVARQLEALGRALRQRQSRGTNGRNISRLLVSTLRISDGGLITVTADGDVTDGLVGLGNAVFAKPGNAALLQLPDGLSVNDLDTAKLLAGEEQTGRDGGIVFVAQPLTPTASGRPVLLLTQTVDEKATRQARGFFLIAAMVAVGLAIVTAAFLARRLTRPLAAMGDTARSIAEGDLAARVDLGRHPEDELADLARTLNAMAAQLEHARGMERAFILSVSHDLRTPLTSIRGYAEAMIDGAVGTDHERARAANVISTEARRLERLVADLLDLARLDARQFSLAPRPIDAAETVRTTVDAFRPAATELGIALEVDAPARLAADADPDRLAQIIANLVENALKYAAATIVVELVPYRTAELDVRVRDDGPGIDPADLPQVFDRLYVSRTVPGRSVGTGIGLAVVRELAAAMGGSAWVDTPDGTGATFVVRLPILRPVTVPTP